MPHLTEALNHVAEALRNWRQALANLQQAQEQAAADLPDLIRALRT